MKFIQINRYLPFELKTTPKDYCKQQTSVHGKSEETLPCSELAQLIANEGSIDFCQMGSSSLHLICRAGAVRAPVQGAEVVPRAPVQPGVLRRRRRPRVHADLRQAARVRQAHVQ